MRDFGEILHHETEKIEVCYIAIGDPGTTTVAALGPTLAPNREHVQ